MRISAHKLEIEAGRYSTSAKNNNSETTKRLCKNCNLSEVEDESHALLSCPKYEVGRKAMLNTLEDAFPHLQASSVKDKFIFIMKCNDSEVTLALSKKLTAIKIIKWKKWGKNNTVTKATCHLPSSHCRNRCNV